MFGCIALSYFSSFYIDFHDAEATDEVGIRTGNADAADSLVASNDFLVEVADIDNVAITLHQVDISILIDHNQSFSLWTPIDVGDMGITQSVRLVVGIDALIVEIILVEVVACHYEKVVTSFFNLLHLMVSHIGFPSADLGN